ncbi:MAG: TetR/AcrR family transcriptional regulator [Chitinispirillales bacterium]|jgi:AcrR family transcriptional regulator|nr:TetR/AcrR family transcriptional regulator [Chitinispirillales bacterium]
MHVFNDNVYNNVEDAENAGADSTADGGGGGVDAVDPKSARRDAVWGMKRELIMDAAIKVMSREGIMNVRLEEVAEEAGFSKAAVYHYFPDKEAIIINVMIREQRSAYERLSEVIDRGLPFVDTIREFAGIIQKNFLDRNSAAFERTTPSPSMLSSFVVSMTKHEELFNETMLWRNKMDGLLMKIVARAKTDGTLAIPIDDATVTLYIGAFFQAVMAAYMQGIHSKGGAPKCGGIHEVTDKLLLFFKPWINEKTAVAG